MYDIEIEKGSVTEIIKELQTVDFIWVKVPGSEKCKAVNYKKITGSIKVGDRVLLNTTAVNLNLGTGGYHFVFLNLSYIDSNLESRENYNSKIGNIDDLPNNNFLNSPGHIMKMRYTPIQMRTLSIEEENSPYHNIIKGFDSLAGSPVIIIPLHSLLAAVLISYKFFYPDKKVVYIMSEGGSLALEFSNLVRLLKTNGYLDSTITYGNAFGGDYETVNIFTALVAAKAVAEADLIVVGMGPGIVGTSSKYGFTGVESVFIEKAVRVLKGKSIVVPRISFADKRQRHYGLSHHTITLLSELISEPVEIAFPDKHEIKVMVKELQINKKHNIDYYSIKDIGNILEQSNFPFYSMGRSLIDDPLFFITAGLAVYKL